MNRNDTHSLAHVRLLLGPFQKQRQSLLKMIPRLNVLNYVCSYSAFFSPNTPRTVYECRCQPSPSHENQSCAVEIKASSFVFSLYYSWKQKFITFPQYFVFVWSSIFESIFFSFPLSMTLNPASPQNIDIFTQDILSVITCTHSSGIFTLSASPATTNLSSLTESHALVKAASLEFNTFFRRCRLGSHDHAVPWPLTWEAQTIVLSGSIGQYTAQKLNPAKCLRNIVGEQQQHTAHDMKVWYT